MRAREEATGRRSSVALVAAALVVAATAGLLGWWWWSGRSASGARLPGARSAVEANAPDPSSRVATRSGNERAFAAPVRDAAAPPAPPVRSRATPPDRASPDGDAGGDSTPMQRFAMERATFVTEINAMLGHPPARRFTGTEPTIGWRRDFGHGLRRQSSTLRACFERSPAREGAAGGLIEYELAVDADGRVTDAAITADPVGDAALAECLLEALRQLTVPASGVGTLSYRGAVLVGGARYTGPRPPRAASQPGDGLTFVHVVRGLGPLPE